jgi:hypothetical protein
MSWFKYIFTYLIPKGIRELGNNFRMWKDLMTGNYADYALLKEDDPFEECKNWFWYGINADETYPKEFLEYLQELCDRIDRGEEKLIPVTIEDLREIEELLDVVTEEE